MSLRSRVFSTLASALFLFFSAAAQPAVPASECATGRENVSCLDALESCSDSQETEARLKAGEVVVDLIETDNIKFVVGKIIIKQRAESVWPILVNPFEFERKICPRMKHVDVMVDQPECSVLKCSMFVCMLFPTINYVVQSTYEAPTRVQFRRVSGCLKDFKGCWLLKERDNGESTEVIYSMYLDPGMPVPKWIVREGVKSELPHTLTGLRDRVEAVTKATSKPDHRNIAASAWRAKPLASRKGSV